MAELSELTAADIAEVMRIERLPGYDAVVGRFEADEHARQISLPSVRYFGVRAGAGLGGFVILQELDQPTALLRRIAVDQVERGTGTFLVRAVMDWVFDNTPAEALKLDVALGNPRAKHVYEREGFATYGADDVHYFLSIPRARWIELRRR
ncbi:MAG: GNAT family N-acetyltransferase [Caulobacterales bacterium]|nr:GNAT family N-acetyltransferase [Caulobacterales bacterium]